MPNISAFSLKRNNNSSNNKFGKPLTVPGGEKFIIVSDQFVFILTHYKKDMHACPILRERAWNAACVTLEILDLTYISS